MRIVLDGPASFNLDLLMLNDANLHLREQETGERLDRGRKDNRTTYLKEYRV